MWVKICANTSAADTAMAAELGADAVGFVFAPSVRQVTVAAVPAMTAGLPAGVERVGVFGKMSADEIVRACETAGLTAAQLHGGFDPALAEEVKSRGVEVIYTVAWAVGEDSGERVGAELAAIAARQADARVLVDAKVGKASGGLGVAFDWEAAAGVLRGQSGLRVIVAGGLRVETVGEAVRVMAPWGVDVASGVEARAGVKDVVKVRGFLRAARKG